MIKKGVNLVNQLPLAYLFSKPELRHYGMARAARLLVKPAIASIVLLLRYAFWKWKSLPLKELDDRQIGSIVIAKCFSNLYEKCIGVKFKWWAFVCADRFKDR